MDSRKQRKALLLNMLLATIIISSMLFVIEATSEPKEKYGEVGSSILTWSDTYKRIYHDYVKDVDGWDLAKNSIEGMLENLDPYSSFFPATNFRQMNEDTKGEFAGLGIEISTVDNYPKVMSSPIDNTPAMRVGLRAGDVIVKIEGESTYDMHINDVVSRLRGKKGTVVNISIQRGDREELMAFSIKRDTIPLVNIPYSGEIEENIGYIKLARFNAKAPEEMKEALSSLVENDNLKGIILDLRYNPGGLLNIAQDMSNVFLPRNSLIVSVRGRNPETGEYYNAEQTPLYPSKSLVVLVNRGSASASEIVAGAIQDHDRGVLIGDTTFGKGSVQTLFQLPERRGLKLTTAYYYTPSGRCIHREHDPDAERVAFSRDEEELTGKKPESIEADSLDTRDKFYTLNKERVVFGGGGVTPDIILKEEFLGNIVIQLVSQSIVFDFAVEYCDKHPELAEDFVVDDALVKEFWEYINNNPNFEYKIPGHTHLERFVKAVEHENYDGDVIESLNEIEKTLTERRRTEFDANIETIKRIIKREIASSKFGSAARTIASKEWDIQLQKAIEVINNSEMYNSILSEGVETGQVEE